MVSDHLETDSTSDRESQWGRVTYKASNTIKGYYYLSACLYLYEASIHYLTASWHLRDLLVLCRRYLVKGSLVQLGYRHARQRNTSTSTVICAGYRGN